MRISFQAVALRAMSLRAMSLHAMTVRAVTVMVPLVALGMAPALAQKPAKETKADSKTVKTDTDKSGEGKTVDSKTVEIKTGDKGNDNGILPGAKSGDPVNIDATKLDYYDKDQKLVYTGNVVAVQGEATLLAPTLTIFMMPKDTSNGNSTPSSTNNQVRRMEATGPVTLKKKDQIGTGDSGVYIKADNKVYLYGNVTLTQGPNVTKGDKLVYDLKTSQAVVTGKVRSLFVPNDTNGSKDSEPAPAPATKKPKTQGESSQNTSFKTQ